jgi:hypothetical protein
VHLYALMISNMVTLTDIIHRVMVVVSSKHIPLKSARNAIILSSWTT